MSLYVAAVGVVKIKEELAEQFGYFFDENYAEITDSVLDAFVEKYHSNMNPQYIAIPLKKWRHENEKEKWKGKYKTSLQDGILTYGVSYNISDRSVSTYIIELQKIISEYVAEEVFEKDYWTE